MARPAPARRQQGFTLLEVLAAVAILGIWFTVLASVAIQGQRTEGENERRMRASLLADRILTGLELDFDEGTFPEEGGEELEEDEFLVAIESLPLLEADLAGIDPALVELLEGELAAFAGDLRVVRVDVTWTEGSAEERVWRLAYAWDPTRFRELAGELPENEGLPGQDGLDPDQLPQELLQ